MAKISKTLRQNIQRIRLCRKITQGDICRKLGMDRSYMNAIEGGKRNITLYGILESQIKKITGSNITIISGIKVIPKKIKNYLKKHPEIDRKLGKNGVVNFYTTDLTQKFVSLESKFFGKKIKAQKISLNSL